MISALVTEASKENNIILNWVLYINYLIWFKKNKVQALINSDSKVNVIISIYTLKLGLQVCHTNIRTQKIDGFTFKIFKMVLASFQIKDSTGRAGFF